MKLAEEGIARLEQSVDTIITIPNQNLFRVATEQTTNLDFNDVRTVMDEMGKAMMGTGEATGERRAIEAAESAISNPLLDDVSLKGARGVLINITGGRDLTLFEVDEAASLIRAQVDEDANIIVGSALDDDLDGIVRVSVVATGVGSQLASVTPPLAPPVHPQAQEEENFDFEEEAAYASDVSPIEAHPSAAGNERHGVPRLQPTSQTPPPMPKPAAPAPTYKAPRPYPPKIQVEETVSRLNSQSRVNPLLKDHLVVSLAAKRQLRPLLLSLRRARRAHQPAPKLPQQESFSATI